MYEYRCDERLKTKAEGSTRPTYTGLCGDWNIIVKIIVNFQVNFPVKTRFLQSVVLLYEMFVDAVGSTEQVTV